MCGFAAFTLLVTVVTASVVVFRQQGLAGDNLTFLTVLSWQAMVHGIWIPIAAVVWLLFRDHGSTAGSLKRFLFLGAMAVPAHVFLATLFDIGFSQPGSADLVGFAVARAQLDLLTYSAFGVVAVAAAFQREAHAQTEAAAKLGAALDASRRALADHKRAGPSEAERLTVMVGTKRSIVPVEDVEWFGSAANYVVVNWDGREGLIRQTLQSREQMLNPEFFARSHRTTIANLAKVEHAEPMADGSWRLRMMSGAELVVSRTYRDAILRRLKIPVPRPD